MDNDADDEMDELSTTPTPGTLNQLAGNLGNRKSASDGIDSPPVVLSIANAKGKREDHWQRRLDKVTNTSFCGISTTLLFFAYLIMRCIILISS